MNLAKQFPQVAFGTSGVRALVSELTPKAVACYVCAFVARMRDTVKLKTGAKIAVGMDLRPSSPEIASTICTSLRELEFEPDFLGALPTPALAHHCASTGIAGIMITGSHIPFDRNGIKFYSPSGEILKDDELAISLFNIPENWRNREFSATHELPEVNSTAVHDYTTRYTRKFGSTALSGYRIGVYEHSAVGRDITKDILQKLGATVVALGRSDEFIPVDTEAVSEEDLRQASDWCKQHKLDALVSTDGDGDRPLVFDANGQFVRGDLLGLLCAKTLDIKTLAIPVSCNSAIEKSGVFANVKRTKIGSPYVIAAMQEIEQSGARSVAGFEANGGFLLGKNETGLAALPTRDAILPVVTVLSAAVHWGTSLAKMIEALPARFTHSDRVKNVPTEYSRKLLDQLLNDSATRQRLFPQKDNISSIDTTDGVRLTFSDGDIAHLRPSGNAPELRCYAESDSYDAAKRLCLATLNSIQ